MNRRTFTILELLIVLLILGVIVALSIEQYNGSKELAKTYTFVTNVNVLANSFEPLYCSIDNATITPSISSTINNSSIVYVRLFTVLYRLAHPDYHQNLLSV